MGCTASSQTQSATAAQAETTVTKGKSASSTSRAPTSTSTTTETTNTTTMSLVETYKLQHPGTCSGMFWRGDPRPNAVKVKQIGNDSWPRNGSLLKGTVHELPDMKWLEVTSWKQVNSDKWIDNCQGIWMQFDQGGLLLFKQ